MKQEKKGKILTKAKSGEIITKLLKSIDALKGENE